MGVDIRILAVLCVPHDIGSAPSQPPSCTYDVSLGSLATATGASGLVRALIDRRSRGMSSFVTKLIIC